MTICRMQDIWTITVYQIQCHQLKERRTLGHGFPTNDSLFSEAEDNLK
jgi:hypothetical protein